MNHLFYLCIVINSNVSLIANVFCITLLESSQQFDNQLIMDNDVIACNIPFIVLRLLNR